MLETYFPVSRMPEHLRSGPSGPHLDGFAATLERQGYIADTAVRYLRAAAHLGHVLAPTGALPSDIDLRTFIEHLRRCRCSRAKGGRNNHHTIHGARLFHRYLIEISVCRPAVTATPVEPQLVTGFKAWLRKHRGASEATIKLYARYGGRLLTALGEVPTIWDAAAIRRTFMDHASTSGRVTIKKMTTSLRTFLRYLAVEGRCRAGLDSAVPAYAHWQLADMPRYLSSEHVNRLIDAVMATPFRDGVSARSFDHSASGASRIACRLRCAAASRRYRVADGFAARHRQVALSSRFVRHVRIEEDRHELPPANHFGARTLGEIEGRHSR